MKTKISLLIAAIFFTGTIFAQGFTLGIKGGANLGKISGKTFKDEFKFGYQIGGFATIPLGGRIGIQPEVLFNQTNLDTSSNFSDVYNFNNVSGVELKQLLIPILLNINLNKYLTIQAGPQFGVIIDQDKNLLQNGQDAFKAGTFSAAAGIQLNLLKFRVYGRFTGGLTDVDNVGNNDTWKIQNIQVGVGLAL